ncbi:MAG: hypothetical protein KatS3mg114_1026 [Planctomycetaceae bacterium]|nr:MAG: hypothetical protein KatS3mg114_1026 [Planctomycetaceae bacterium]
MGLAELFEQRFRSDIRFRGEAYFRSERVAVVKVTPDDLHAEVRDGVMHHTRLQRHEGQLKFICSCTPPGTNGQQAYCKHVWATLLSVDEGNYLQGTPKPGFIPPFLTQSSSLDLPPSAVEREDSSPATKLHPTSRTATGSPRLWEDILRQMRSALTDQDTTPIPGNREREIYYEIDLRASDDEGMLILQTSQRQRRNNGEWGKLKPLKLRPGKFDEIDDPEDRRILAYLMGATPERGTSSGGMGETWAAVHRYRVPHDLCLLLLPTIAATGRLRIADEDERVTEVLRWDPADPWELTLTVQYAAETKLWKLSGWLVRGDERLSLQQPQLLLPGGLVLHQHTIARLRDYEAFTWARLLRQHVSLEVPQGEEHDLVDRLLDMPVLPRLELPQELQLEQVRIAPTPLITLEAPTKQRWHRERLRATVEFEYDGWRVRGSTFQWAIVDRLQQRCILRDDQRENELWAQLEQAGFRRLLDQRHSQHDVEIVIRDLGFAVRKLIQQGWVVRAADKQVRQPLHLQFRVKSAIDWFELHAHLEFDGASASLPELLAALRRGDGTIRLDDGSWGILPEEWLAQFGLLAQLGQLDEDHLKFSTVQAGLLDALLSTLPGVNYDARYRQARQMLGHATSVEPLQEPDSFQGTLRPYQRYGVGWLQFLQTARFGGCLADDMGLGKTIQLLAYFEHRRRLGQIRGPSLIVVPKSLLFNWRQECERFTPQLRVLEYTGLDRATLREQFSQHHIVLTTYGTLRRDILVLKDQRFDYVVLDEAQAIKNPGSQIAKAVRLLQAEHRLALTGTPHRKPFR